MGRRHALHVPWAPGGPKAPKNIGRCRGEKPTEGGSHGSKEAIRLLPSVQRQGILYTGCRTQPVTGFKSALLLCVALCGPSQG